MGHVRCDTCIFVLCDLPIHFYLVFRQLIEGVHCPVKSTVYLRFSERGIQFLNSNFTSMSVTVLRHPHSTQDLGNSPFCTLENNIHKVLISRCIAPFRLQSKLGCRISKGLWLDMSKTWTNLNLRIKTLSAESVVFLKISILKFRMQRNILIIEHVDKAFARWEIALQVI